MIVSPPTSPRHQAITNRLIIDFRRMQGLDISTAYNFGKLATLCQDRPVRMILTGLNPK